MLFNDYLLAGGERVSVATEVEALRAAGVDVRLLSVENSKVPELGPLGKAVATFPRREAFEAVSYEIQSYRPDIVHAQNLFPQLGAGAIRAIAQARTPWVRTIRNYRKACIAATFTRDGRPCHECAGPLKRLPGILHGCYQGSRANSIGATNYALWDDRSERSNPPGAYILISKAMQSSIEFALNPKAHVHVVHNGVGRVDVPTPSTLSERTYDLAFVGRLTPEKGVQVALELARTQPHRRIAFVGNGALGNEVQVATRSNPNVHHLLDLDHRGAAAIMAQSRIVLVPSRWDEPFGRVAAEALAYGALPLVSSMGGLPEIVEGLPYDAVLSPWEEERWADAVTGLLDAAPNMLDHYSKECVARWEQNFSPDALANRLTSVYGELTASDERLA